MSESTDPDRETIEEIRVRALRMARNEALVAQDRACIHELIRSVFPTLRGEPPVRGRLSEVAAATGWTRDYVARIRDGKVSLPTQATPAPAVEPGDPFDSDFMREHMNDWTALFCNPADVSAARDAIQRRGWPGKLVQSHRDVPADTVWVNADDGVLALPLEKLGAAASSLIPGGGLADGVRAVARTLQHAGPGCEQ